MTDKKTSVIGKTSSDEISDKKFFENATKDLNRGTSLIKAKCTLEIPNIENDKTVSVRMKSGGQYSYSYTTYKEIRKVINPLLKKAGLFLNHFPTEKSVITRLTHSSGEFEEVEIEMKGSTNTMQDYGGVLSYAKRYGTVLILGLSTEADSDGNDAEGNRHEITDYDKEQIKKPWYNTFLQDYDVFKKKLREDIEGKELLKAVEDKFRVNNDTKAKILSLSNENIDQIFGKTTEIAPTGNGIKKPTI